MKVAKTTTAALDEKPPYPYSSPEFKPTPIGITFSLQRGQKERLHVGAPPRSVIRNGLQRAVVMPHDGTHGLGLKVRLTRLFAIVCRP